MKKLKKFFEILGLKNGYSKADRQTRIFFDDHSNRKRNKSSVKNLVYFGVVNSQELVGGSHHINLVRFALGSFFVNKLVHRFIFGAVFENYVNDLEKSLAKMRRTAFGNASGFNVNISGLVWRSVKPGKSSDRFTAMEASGITDLRNQLRSQNLANTEHLHNNVVFGELFRKRGHLLLKFCKSFTGTVQLCGRLRQQCGYVIAIRERWNECFGIVVYCICFAMAITLARVVFPVPGGP